MNKTKQAGFGLFTLLIVFILIAGLASTTWYVYASGKMAGTKIGPFTIPSNIVSSATLTGIVLLNPSMPLCAVGSPCSAPLANYTIEAQDDSGHVSATAKTDAAGVYIMQLMPGHYTLMLVPAIRVESQSNGSVTVVAGLNHKDLTVDSGIR